MTWLREAATTIRDYVRGETVEVMRNQILLATLNQRGLVSLNNEGTELDWRIRYRQVPIQGFGEGATLSFAKQNRWKEAVLPMRASIASDQIDKAEKLKNKGKAAIVQVFSRMAEMLLSDFEEQFPRQFYNDGASLTTSIHGIESFLSAGSLLSGAPVANPNSTYAGISCALGNYGGTWDDTTKWPLGSGDAHYDFYSPLIVDYTSTNANNTTANGWSAATKTWDNTCIEAMRFGITHVNKNKSKRKNIQLILLDRQMYLGLVKKYQAEERLHVTPDNGPSGAWKLGFTDMINFDGVDVTHEFWTPSNKGYGFCLDAMELRSWQEDMFNSNGPFFDEATMTYRYFVDFYGNLQVDGVRSFLKFAALT